MLNSKHDFLKDIQHIRSLSSILDKKLSEVKPSDSDKIDKLTLDELQDLEKIAGIADFMLTKYADKKEMRSILKHFTSVIIDPFVTSEPEPAVVGIAIIGKELLSVGKDLPIISSIDKPLIPTAIALAASIELPPPNPITISTLLYFAIEIPSFTSSDLGSGEILSKIID